MTRTDPERWATMFKGNVGFVRSHLAACEYLADQSGETGPDWTRCVRGELWKRWRERWRDDRVKLERERDRKAAAANSRPKAHEKPVADFVDSLLRGVKISG